MNAKFVEAVEVATESKRLPSLVMEHEVGRQEVPGWVSVSAG